MSIGAHLDLRTTPHKLLTDRQSYSSEEYLSYDYESPVLKQGRCISPRIGLQLKTSKSIYALARLRNLGCYSVRPVIRGNKKSQYSAKID